MLHCFIELGVGQCGRAVYSGRHRFAVRFQCCSKIDSFGELAFQNAGPLSESVDTLLDNDWDSVGYLIFDVALNLSAQAKGPFVTVEQNGLLLSL